MRISNHNEALDHHSALLASLTPVSNTDAMIRTSVIVGPIMSRIAGEPYDQWVKAALKKNGGAGRLETSIQVIDMALGEGYFNKELTGFIAQELATLRNGQTIFCTEEIIDEILEAQETMLDSIILPQDVFTESGLIFLEKPYRYTNIIAPSNMEDIDTWQREEFIISAIMFTAASDRIDNNGVAVYLYGHWNAIHIFDEGVKPDEHTKPYCSYIYNPETKEVAALFPDDNLVDTEIKRMRQYEEYFSSVFRDKAKGIPLMIDATFFEYGETTTKYDAEVLRLKRFLLAFFRLTYEYLEVQNSKVERGFHKRAKRAGRTVPTDGYLTVMTLRRKIYDESIGGIQRNGPSYAFRVRGHWKKAYMRSRNLPVGDPGAYRHIYVKDYIKGRGLVVKSKRVIKVGD